jgi:2-iminobutanoate/2-iminopropanoate deaminase
MSIERKNYARLGRPVGAYVHAVKHGGLLYVSGLTAFGTPAQGQGLAQQAEAVLGQIRPSPKGRAQTSSRF